MEARSLDEWLAHASKLLKPPPGVRFMNERMQREFIGQVATVLYHIARQRKRIEKTAPPKDLLEGAMEEAKNSGTIVRLIIGPELQSLHPVLFDLIIEGRYHVNETLTFLQKIRNLPSAKKIIEEKTSIAENEDAE